MILLLCDDLLFASRITGTARAQNLPINPVRSSEALLHAATNQSTSCVILDLANPGLAVGDVLRQLRDCCTPMPFVAAFGSHVDTDTLKAARDAGCDVVWPRSKLADELVVALPAWVAAKQTSKS